MKTIIAATLLTIASVTAIAGGLNVSVDFSPYVGESHDRLCVTAGATIVSVESMECNEQFSVVQLGRNSAWAAINTQGSVRFSFDPPVLYVAGQVSTFKNSDATLTCYGSNAFGPVSTGPITAPAGWSTGLGTPNNDDTLWDYCDFTHGQMYRFHVKPQ